MDKITIIKWDNQLGPQPIIQYPPEKDFLEKEIFLKIWAKYELQKEKSLIILSTEDESRNYLSVAQKYESDLYFLVLEIERSNHNQNFDDYFEILASISKNVIELIHSDQFMRALSEGHNQIKSFVKLDKEQNFLNLFRDKIKQKILTILEKGAISKSELIRILSEDFGFSTVNMDLLLTPFIKEELILKKDIPGVKECLFLINDLSFFRIPPKIIKSDIGQQDKSIADFSEDMSNKLKNFFINFDCIPEIKDNSLISLLFDEKIFNLIKVLRKKSISVLKTLSILENKQGIFEDLIEKKIIIEKAGRVYLFSDVRFITFIPLFLIKDLKSRYKNLEITSDQYLTHIEVLLNQLNKKKKQIYTII